MQLNDFLSRHNLSMSRFARLVGTTTATISRIADASVMPRRPLILRIYEATDGLVTANDLAGTYCKHPCPTALRPEVARQIDENDGEDRP